MEKAIEEIQKLSESEQELLASRILDMLEAEKYLTDEDDLDRILNPIIDEDGSIDFEKLNATAIKLTLEDLSDSD